MVSQNILPTNPGGFEHVNLAAFVPRTRVLGPGMRAGIWVQGCAFSCPGCIAPEWIPQRTNQIIAINDLAPRILAEPTTGLTISGGEPFLQAPALAELVRLLRQVRELDVIVFSGYTLAALRRMPQAAGLLEQVDLLVDGTYVAARNRGVGLRGSDNQCFHFLSSRLQHSDYPFETVARGTELHFQGDDLLIVGIPAHGVQVALDQAVQSARLEGDSAPYQMVMGFRA